METVWSLFYDNWSGDGAEQLIVHDTDGKEYEYSAIFLEELLDEFQYGYGMDTTITEWLSTRRDPAIRRLAKKATHFSTVLRDAKLQSTGDYIDWMEIHVYVD